MLRVKICGITRPEDALVAAAAGADAIGLVFAESPRRIDVERAAAIVDALPPFVTPVALFVNETPERILETCCRVGATVVQLSGGEPPEVASALLGQGLSVIKAFHVREEGDLAAIADYPAAAYLLDSRVAGRHGGTGVAFDWSLAAVDLPKPVILAGGLCPENVAEAVRQVRPYAVDVSSGVEAAPGIKDPARVHAFVENARRALEART